MDADLWQAVQHVFKQQFNNPDLVVERDTTAGDVEGWDSLAHLNLVTAFEKAFEIRFTTSEILKFKCVGDVADLIMEKKTKAD